MQTLLKPCDISDLKTGPLTFSKWRWRMLSWWTLPLNIFILKRQLLNANLQVTTIVYLIIDVATSHIFYVRTWQILWSCERLWIQSGKKMENSKKIISPLNNLLGYGEPTLGHPKLQVWVKFVFCLFLHNMN